MPNSTTHSNLTAAALRLQLCETGDNSELIREYCSLPDLYFSNKRDEVAPYIFFTDGIQFHYPPDTPYCDLYRYWVNDEKGLHRSRSVVNENFRHVTAGFAFYISRTVDHFRNGQYEEGKKYMGCLLHMLEDSTFGLHSLEGAGGTDAFALDRLIDAPLQPSRIMASLQWREDFPLPEHTPSSLGNSVDEVVMKLYAAYCASSSDSRKCAFRYIMNTLENREEENFSLATRMYSNAVRLCADVIHTLFQLGRNEKQIPDAPCPLTGLEPFEFPFGGFAPYKYRSFVRNGAYDTENNFLPLEVAHHKFRHGLSFGTHAAGTLSYQIAPDTFRQFRAVVGFHKAVPVNGEAHITFFNDGKEEYVFTLNEKNSFTEVHIAMPRKELRLTFRSTGQCGVIVVGEPELFYL